jgi:hypothetical protein
MKFGIVKSNRIYHFPKTHLDQIFTMLQFQLYGSSSDLEDWRTVAHYHIDDGCTVSLTKRNINLVSIENGVEKISANAGGGPTIRIFVFKIF